MKIAVVVPNSTMPADVLDLRRQFLEANASAGTELAMWRNDLGPESIETEAQRDEAAVEIVRNVRARDLTGIHGIIPWCAADPALDSLRQEVSVPVVGPLMASCGIATNIGRRFTIVIPRGDVPMTRQRVQGYGYGSALVKVRQVDRPVLELRTDMNNTIELLTREVELAAREDQADCVVLGCMALFGVASQLKASIPVIDPALAALTTCESWIRMGISNSVHPRAA
ncbi:MULTISPECIES: aspartate/glutamate racemase family protein [unclassified Mesorhizobium]|uniref:aspartate/glutamate racemase family protein n=1 Tax=unclassified Mesorhizobium TaxID=325217 RepID=UPI0008EA55D6|nr:MULTISPECIES: aspartate/glutamate racemase family protein [unclassified Mesorhizobium]RJG44901.1 hypothetical protein D3Y55_11910 [Mesorhizobium sp. DCY119]SFT78777.1 allantoin racemase [Mesorhizobium sp. YR577]